MVTCVPLLLSVRPLVADRCCCFLILRYWAYLDLPMLIPSGLPSLPRQFIIRRVGVIADFLVRVPLDHANNFTVGLPDHHHLFPGSQSIMAPTSHLDHHHHHQHSRRP